MNLYQSKTEGEGQRMNRTELTQQQIHIKDKFKEVLLMLDNIPKSLMSVP